MLTGCLTVNLPDTAELSEDDPGLASPSPSPSPSPVAGARAVLADEMTSCVLQSGGLTCWGENGHYEKLDGTTTDLTSPQPLPGFGAGVTSFEFGFNFGCAVVNGGVKCWGYNNYGQLGDGTNVNRTAPVDVIGLSSGVVKVVAGARVACALLTGGGVKCWGENDQGELGRGFTDAANGYQAVPDFVSGLSSGVTDIFAGGMRSEHICALVSGGAYCWGYNAFGQLGDGTTTTRNVPTAVLGYGTAGSGVVSIAPSRYSGCLLLSNGTVKCWGFNSYGQLGDNSTTNSPSPVTTDLSALGAGEKVTSVGLGEDQSCLLSDAGAVYCWGRRNVGQLGDGVLSGANVIKPQTTLITSGAAQLSVGRYHACVVTTGNVVECWGLNTFGQLGQGNTTNLATPAQIGL